MSTAPCACKAPTPAPGRDGETVCAGCGGLLREETAPRVSNRAKLSDDERDRRIRSLERQVRQIQLQIQELKAS
jgi:uncharacterized Zn finger protein (UPF0148 family)